MSRALVNLFAVLVVFSGVFADRRYLSPKPEDVICSTVTLSNAGRISEERSSRLAREYDTNENNEELAGRIFASRY